MTKKLIFAVSSFALITAGCSSDGPKETAEEAAPQNSFGFYEAMESEGLPVVSPPSRAPSNAITINGKGITITGKQPEPAPTTYRYQPTVTEMPVQSENRERYDGKDISDVMLVQAKPVSTFSVDVDTGSYSNTRRFLTQGQLPPQAAVRTEEMINYFRYDYPLPQSRETPFSVTTNVAKSPWNNESRLLRIGIRGYDLDRDTRPPTNLVFLLDVSGSMNAVDKLPLVKSALGILANKLTPRDKVSIVVYAGAAGMVLEPTASKSKIRAALDNLEAGGSTAGGQGIELAYQTARASFIKGGVNRVILATDGDFNVGLTDRDGLIKLVEKNRESGITLTTLGFGQGNYNEAMMEQIANVGNGNYAYIDNAMEARKVLDEEMSSTLFTIAKDVKIQVEFNPAIISQYRLIGYENRALRNEDFDNDGIDAGDIGAGHQVTAIYEVIPTKNKGWLSDRRYAAVKRSDTTKLEEMAFIKLRYKMPGGKVSKLIQKPIGASSLQDAGLPRGDMAFATAVAAFAQKMRGDTKLTDFSYQDIANLAGKPRNYWRQEFLKLTELADGHSAS